MGLLLAGACVLAGWRREGAVRFGSAEESASLGQMAPLSQINRADMFSVAGIGEWADWFRRVAIEASRPRATEASRPRATDRSPPRAPDGSRPRETGGSRPRAESYPLDSVGRTLGSGQLSCPNVDARDFSGESLRFSPAAKVVEPFRQRLLVFEQVVREVSERVYGRSPSAILVADSYSCRSVGGENRKLSEHALGNAIDITGFEFAPTAFAPPAWAPAPSVPLGGFQVRVDRHWQATGDTTSAKHAYFLDQLTRELVQRNVFRTLLGPAHPDHSDHFHFDMAPWSYVHL